MVILKIHSHSTENHVSATGSMNIPHSIFTLATNLTAGETSTKGPPRPSTAPRRSSVPDCQLSPWKAFHVINETEGAGKHSTSKGLPISATEPSQTLPWNIGKVAEGRSSLPDRSVSFLNVHEVICIPLLNPKQKRQLPTEFQIPLSPKEQRPFKKARLRIPLRHSAEAFIPSRTSTQPPSPLFFSHRSPQKPPLTLRFSSSEAGATMLSNANKEDSGGVKTVRLARGTISTSGPPRAMSTPNGKIQGDRAVASRTSTSPPDEKARQSDIQVLNHIGIVELLELDERPTFVIDLSNQLNYQPGHLQILFANPSLRAYAGLLELVVGKGEEETLGLAGKTTFSEFKAWTTSFVKSNESLNVCLPSFFYSGFTWTCSTLRKRLRLFSGSFSSGSTGISSNPPSTATSAPSALVVQQSNGLYRTEPILSKQDYFGDAQVTSSAGPPVSSLKSETMSTTETPDPSFNGHDEADNSMLEGNQRILLRRAEGVEVDQVSPLGMRHDEATLGAAAAGQFDSFGTSHTDPGFFDWTRLPNTPALPPHVQFTRSIDWASTGLGPIEEWPSALRGMCNLIMASPHPAALYWGDELISIYNEAFILLAGQKHPKLMGQRYEDAWAEIWDLVKDVFANARITGQATMKDDDCLFIMRNGFLEETYFSWSIIPLVGEDGSVVGCYNPCFEKTRRKIAERRMLTLREVGEKTAVAREVKSFWGQVLKGLEYNDYDTPFVLLYSVSDELDSDASSLYSNSLVGAKQCMLEGTLGVPEGHPAAPHHIDLKTGTEGFGLVFREALTFDRPVLLQTDNGTLNVDLIDGMSWRGFGDACRAAAVCPIHLTTGDSVLGFLVIGINPRRPYDDDYNLFVQLLSRQLATSMASVVLFEEEIKRGQRAAKLAAQDRIELSEQLAARTQEAVESETKFTRMAEFAPVGMFIADSAGRITYCNDTWYEISRVPKEKNSTDKWMDSVKDEDKTMVVNLWSNLINYTVPMNAEFRFKAAWEDRNGSKGDTWVLASAYPEKNADGTLLSVFGSITNISQQKWAEDFQKRRREEAVEMKRQQENFIDITSHEMRNPLSAILQCADEISSSLIDFKSDKNSHQLTTELVNSNIDAAQIIALCASHQKRIVDDILTLSKLDSALLLVTPVDVQPVAVVQRALKMFEGELLTADISLELQIDESIKEHDIEWVRLDPSRLLQVMINLTTNAIKFTTTQAKRTIVVKLGASLQRSPKIDGIGLSYFPTRSKRKDLTESPDWGDGDEVYLHFAVQDTGRGLNAEEKKLLFQRFSQASPRTHVQYGGSGLGLFISRELVELQGGEIGVSSESGKGSTFAFYIKVRKSSAPNDAIEQLPPNPRKILQGKPTKPSSTVETGGSTQLATSQQNHQETTLKVLIVEDNLVNQRVLQKQLRNIGCIVHVANHGGECIDKLKQSKYWKGHEDDGLDLGVILMDWEMPVMDGLTCARKIRELQRSGEVVRHVPIIAVTANVRSEQVLTALEAGMVCHNG